MPPDSKLRRIHPLWQNEPPAPTTFTRFRELPGELHNLVYELYFADTNITIGAKGQPQTKHGTALLFTSKKIHEEALVIMYKTATFSVNLDKEHAPSPKRDFVWSYENGYTFEDQSCVRTRSLQKFDKVQFVLNTPSKDWNLDHWKYSYPIFYIYLQQLKASQNVQYKLNVGKLCPQNVFDNRHMYMRRHVFKEMKFSGPMVRPACKENCAGKCQCTTPEEHQRRLDTLHRMTAFELERGCRVMTLSTLGREARRFGATIWLESHDGKRKNEITADNVVDLIEQADGFDNDNDIWVVAEQRC